MSEFARMSDGNTGLRSGRIWHSSAGNSFSFSTTFGAGFLISLLFLCGAVSAQAQDSHPAKQIEAPKPKQVVSPDAAFAEARRLTLQVHGAIYLSLAFAAYGPLSRGPAGIALAAVCYAGVRWTPLRIFLFAGIAWTTANFAASIAPTSLQLALKLVIYGAALIVLPRLRANRAAGSADSERCHRRYSEHWPDNQRSDFVYAERQE